MRGAWGTEMAGWTVFWNTVSEPQATIIAAALTIIAATVGVVLGSWLFGGRVKDLKGALDHSDQLLQDHKAQVDATLGGKLTKKVDNELGLGGLMVPVLALAIISGAEIWYLSFYAAVFLVVSLLFTGRRVFAVLRQ